TLGWTDGATFIPIFGRLLASSKIEMIRGIVHEFDKRTLAHDIRRQAFLTIICLIFKLPDWLSMMLFKRAHFMLDDEDKRHGAILHILRVQTENGIEAANEYLYANHLKPLSLE
ncbi:MAG: hypothetical protein K6G63_07210, partial [Eubacterium sp.]|nr:hypothetical protein [Eubacterium sp.]